MVRAPIRSTKVDRQGQAWSVGSEHRLLRTEPVADLAVRLAQPPPRAWRGSGGVAPSGPRSMTSAAVALGGTALEQVHARRADEAGDEDVGRVVVDLERRADLLQHAMIHHRDAVGHRHRLELVMGDIDHGLLELPLQVLQLGAHHGTERGIDIGQRLVEQEDRRLHDRRAADGDALQDVDRQPVGLAVEQRRELQQLGDRADAAVDLRRRRAAHRAARRPGSGAPSYG